MENTENYNLLSHLEQKCSVLRFSSCLMSLNAMSMSLAVDACRTARFFELLLEQWQECLPLGDAYDVNFSLWGQKTWEMIKQVGEAYSLNRLCVNIYEYETESYVDFKESQQSAGIYEATLQPLLQTDVKDVPRILVCSLRDLSEVLMEISEYLNSPTEELITTSYEKWVAAYKRHYQRTCRNQYKKWKIQYSARTLRKHLQERMSADLETFKKRFLNEDEFEQVFDTEQQKMDFDGMARFLFTHADRFGVSFIDERPMFSQELQELFNFVETWRLMEADLHPTKKRTEKQDKTPEIDELELKVNSILQSIEQLADASWAQHLPLLWKHIFMAYRSEIAKAGPHEKFKEFSKKTLYCIIGELKIRGVYRQDVTNVELSKALEGSNNGMRKYINNGLLELEPSLKENLGTFIGKEIEQISA
ncbi:MAG: hypothetical protein IK144_13975 [Bacteroidaceae bacterium]|nr:hypothetical protein [Bacteroidaceae bacterium]